MEYSSIFKTSAGEREVMAIYDSILERWPVPHEDVRVPTRFGDTFVIASGDKAAPPLVLLHGASSNALSWIGDVPAYCSSFRVYAVDIIGEPGRSSPTRPSFEGPAYAEWMNDLFAGLGLSSAMVLGLSQGGWIALRFAVSNPGMVTKLALLSPAGIEPTKFSFIARAMFWMLFGKKGVDRLNRYVMGGATGSEVDPTALRFMNAIMTHVRSRIEKECIFSDGELSRLVMPVLFVGGGKDVIRSVEDIASRLKKHLPKVTTLILPEAGHALVGLAERILPFLEQ